MLTSLLEAYSFKVGEERDWRMEVEERLWDMVATMPAADVAVAEPAQSPRLTRSKRSTLRHVVQSQSYFRSWVARSERYSLNDRGA